MEAESEDDIAASQTSLERPAPHRGNTMVHVCWHRNTSVSMVDFSIAVEVPAKKKTPALRPQTCSSPPASLFSLSVSECVLYFDHFDSLSLGTGSSSATLHHLYYRLICICILSFSFFFSKSALTLQ